MTRLKEFSPDDTKLKEKMSSHSNTEKRPGYHLVHA